MSKSIVTLAALCFLFCGCEENDLRTPAISVVVHNDINQWKFIDSWAFISDDNGTVFDIQQLSNNSTTELKAVANAAKLNLTIFTVFADGENLYNFRTYTDLPRGQEFHIHDFPANTDRSPAGDINLLINNYMETVAGYGPVYIAAHGIGAMTRSEKNPDNTYSAEMQLFYFPQDLFLSTYRNGVPVYKLIKAITPNADLTLDFNEFIPSETVLEFDERTQVDIGGFINKDDLYSYRVATDHEFSLVSTDDQAFSVGYPNVFSNFFTRIRTTHDGALVQLEKQGSPVVSYEFAEFTYTVNHSDVQAFDATVSENVTHKRVWWMNFDNVSWQVFSSANSKSAVKTIPHELRMKYGDISSLNTLELFTLTLYQHDAGDYHGWVNTKFGDERRPRFEELSREFDLR
jgi:hypothetical protein